MVNFSLYHFKKTGIFVLLGLCIVGISSPLSAEKKKHKEMTIEDLLKAEKKRKKYKAPLQRSAKKAALLSAILPGAGQIYNHAYWKAPIVWGILAGIGYFVVDNFIWYRRAGFAYEAKQKAEMGDNSLLDKVNPILIPLSTSSVRNYRDQFRQSIDQSGLFFLLAWGLNVVEAAVHAHLLSFDVSRNLSMNLRPTLDNSLGQYPNYKLSVSFKLRSHKYAKPRLVIP